jgi:hypothetical protein
MRKAERSGRSGILRKIPFDEEEIVATHSKTHHAVKRKRRLARRRREAELRKAREAARPK